MLAALDPANAERYAENASAVSARITALEEEMRELLAATPARPYVVFHDAYQYFEREFGLAPLGAITITPERGAAAGHLTELREQLGSQDIACVFVEPQFDPGLAQTLVEGSAVQLVQIDPLGVELVPGPGAYELLLRRVAQSFGDCFSAAG